jgi:hypothetical protein
VPSSHQRGNMQSIWRLCVPVLLIGLLLYNPFIALVHHSDGLAYQALARHRATVGASEMQHYSPVQGDTQSEIPIAEIFAKIVVENNQSTSHILEDERLPQRPELIASVWFRPPPAE